MVLTPRRGQQDRRPNARPSKTANETTIVYCSSDKQTAEGAHETEIKKLPSPLEILNKAGPMTPIRLRGKCP